MAESQRIVVVGGRVAGSATALLLARMGHDVLVVDRGDPSSDTLSTHALMRSGVLQLSRWGLLDAVAGAATTPIRRITLGFAEEQVAFDLRSEYGVDTLYAPRRTVLDRILVDAARAEGVEYRTGLRVLDVTRDGAGRVDGVLVGRNGTTSAIDAAFVIGADGVRSRVAEAVGARTIMAHEARNSIIYGYYEGIDATGYEFQFTPGHNVGLIPTNDGMVNVFSSYLKGSMTGVTEDVFRSGLVAGLPELAGRVAEGRRIGPFRRTPGIPGFVREAAGPGWALVGDAGTTKDPISSHGISAALRDAELLAVAVARVVENRAGESVELGRFQTERDRFAIPFFQTTRELSAYRWTATEASALLRQLSTLTNQECEYLVGLPSPQVVAA